MRQKDVKKIAKELTKVSSLVQQLISELNKSSDKEEGAETKLNRSTNRNNSNANVKSFAELILTLARVYCPVDTGDLMASGRIETSENGRPTVIFGEGSVDYALFVHECDYLNHKIGRAKFLEDACVEICDMANSEGYPLKFKLSLGTAHDNAKNCVEAEIFASKSEQGTIGFDTSDTGNSAFEVYSDVAMSVVNAHMEDIRDVQQAMELKMSDDNGMKFLNEKPRARKESEGTQLLDQFFAETGLLSSVESGAGFASGTTQRWREYANSHNYELVEDGGFMKWHKKSH